MTIHERIAWIHRDAIELTTADMVELKHCLKNLIAEATAALEDVRAELKVQRRANFKQMVKNGKAA